MEYEATVEESKISGIVGVDKLQSDFLEKQEFLRQQVDFRVMVRLNRRDKWHEFTGLFLMKDGWTKEKVSQHIKESFSTDQFRHYTFGLFKRCYHNTTNRINNNFKFHYLNNIRLPKKEGTL